MKDDFMILVCQNNLREASDTIFPQVIEGMQINAVG